MEGSHGRPVCLSWKKSKLLIAADTIGKLQYCRQTFGGCCTKDMNGLYNKALGGGSVLDIGVYPISLPTVILRFGSHPL